MRVPAVETFEAIRKKWSDPKAVAEMYRAHRAKKRAHRIKKEAYQ